MAPTDEPIPSLIDRAAVKLQPREGWLSLSALLAFALALPTVIDLDRFYQGFWPIWGHIVILLLVTLILIKRPLRIGWVLALVIWASLLSTVFIILPLRLSLIWTAGWSTFATDSQNGWLLVSSQAKIVWQTTRDLFWRDSLVLSTVGAVFTGPALGMLFWFFYRWQRPLTGVAVALSILGVLRTFNSDVSFPFFATTVLGLACAAIWLQALREQKWAGSQTDFSENIRVTSGVAGVMIAMVLVFAAAVLPVIPYADIARSIRDALTFERGLVTPFASSDSSSQSSSAASQNQPVIPGAPRDVGPSTLLPTAYLLDGPPELADTPVFEATLDGLPSNPADFHWQTATFDEYSGFGWARSPEFATELAAGAVWGDQFGDPQAFQIRQTITWLGPARANYLITGQFHRINQPVTVFERFEGDLVRLQPNLPDVLPSYTAIATTQQIDPEALNAVDYSALINTRFYNRYTQLPDNISERVRELARETTVTAAGPYDQAKALERFLRTFEYTLEIDPPPADREPVDYFLFDLQKGYCDFYATSMVIMARSLGLPARLAVGFNNVTPDQDGRLIITQDRGHSWAEIYFPEYGWVEFEPTASFPTAAEIDPVRRNDQAIDEANELNGDGSVNVPKPTIWLWTIVIMTVLAAGIIWWWRTHRGIPAEFARQVQQNWAARGDEWAQLQETARRSGFIGSRSDTPREFLAKWERFLNAGQAFTTLGERFTRLLEQERYGSGLSATEKGRLRQLVKEFRQWRRPE